jgi:hypothetical protein
MRWELGFKDGHNGRVAILPIVDQSATNFDGQEFIGLYPTIQTSNNTDGEPTLWVRANNGRYVDLDAWLKGKDPYEH